MSSLSAIADKKVEQINTYLNERIANNETLTKTIFVNEALSTFPAIFNQGVTSPHYQTLEHPYRKYFGELLEELHLYDLILSDTDGNVVLTYLHEADFGSNLNTGKQGCARTPRCRVVNAVTNYTGAALCSFR